MSKHPPQREGFCEKRVYSGDHFDRLGHWCARKGKVRGEDGRLYCGIHDPVAVAAKSAKRVAGWEEDARRDRRRWRHDEIRRDLAEWAITNVSQLPAEQQAIVAEIASLTKEGI